MNTYKKYIYLSLLTFFILFILSKPVVAANSDVTLEFFYANGCGHCEEKTPIIYAMEQDYGENITVKFLEVGNSENKNLFFSYGFKVWPAAVVKNLSYTDISPFLFDYDNITQSNLRDAIDYHLLGNYSLKPPEPENNIIKTPFGVIDISSWSLPIITIVLGALDSINPCSFFILLFLLNLLIYAKSRKRMMIIGGIFIFFSGFIYFLLMALLLTTFTIVEQPVIVTIIAGLVALILGALNIKDFFFFKKGPSLSMSDEKKQKLFVKMRNIVKVQYLPTMIVGTIVLAIFANTYELACTLALPVVFTDILIIHNVTLFQAYLYILFYNVVYVIPLVVIVLIFVWTLGRRKLSEFQGRILKLVSGVMMFSFGVLLLFSPTILSNVFITLVLIIISFIISGIIALIWKNFSKVSKL